LIFAAFHIFAFHFRHFHFLTPPLTLDYFAIISLIISLSFSASITRRFHFRRCFSFAIITDATPPASCRR
jgi:hypothetical protein